MLRPSHQAQISYCAPSSRNLASLALIREARFHTYKNNSVGRDRSVVIATRSRLSCPGIESRWGWNFSASPVQTCPVTHRVSFEMGTGSLSRVQNGWWVALTTPPLPRRSAEVKEGVELYLCSPSGPSWPVLDELYLFTSSLQKNRQCHFCPCVSLNPYSFLVFPLNFLHRSATFSPFLTSEYWPVTGEQERNKTIRNKYQKLLIIAVETWWSWPLGPIEVFS
jgi:hypothetical protein